MGRPAISHAHTVAPATAARRRSPQGSHPDRVYMMSAVCAATFYKKGSKCVKCPTGFIKTTPGNGPCRRPPREFIPETVGGLLRLSCETFDVAASTLYAPYAAA